MIYNFSNFQHGVRHDTWQAHNNGGHPTLGASDMMGGNPLTKLDSSWSS